jgi:hypothetical protein
MGFSLIGRRSSTVVLAFLLACANAASAGAQTAPPGDVFNSGSGKSSSGGEFRGVIISITPVGIHRVDVKLQNPANGNIHSVTVEDDIVKGLTTGERVTQYQDPDTGETLLAPTMMVGAGATVPGQAQDTGTGSNPPSTGTNGGVPTYPGGTTDNGGAPTYPGIPTNNGGVPTYPGGATDNGGVPPPYSPYPAPKMVGNLTGSGSVNGIPVDIGGGGPNTIPIPANASIGTQITASNRTGQGNWKSFRGSLKTDGDGYYAEFNEGYFQGYYNGQFRNGWFSIARQIVRLHAS